MIAERTRPVIFHAFILHPAESKMAMNFPPGPRKVSLLHVPSEQYRVFRGFADAINAERKKIKGLSGVSGFFRKQRAQIKVRRILTKVRQFVRSEGIESEDHFIHDENGRLGPLEELTYEQAAKIRQAKVNATISKTD